MSLVVPYDPAWPERFDEEAERLLEALGAIVLEVAHIGSTAVPGMAAAYVEAKRAAEREIAKPDPIDYWEHKRAFVEELLSRARAAAA